MIRIALAPSINYLGRLLSAKVWVKINIDLFEKLREQNGWHVSTLEKRVEQKCHLGNST